MEFPVKGNRIDIVGVLGAGVTATLGIKLEKRERVWRNTLDLGRIWGVVWKSSAMETSWSR